ncbi:MAG: lysylphosphatidylglycerol synthase transmembrane domain-containing protein [Bacteroidales bacterium]|nr:lysylphosphatidylglycerol synthase transmembrane domain-containing protein [Bacteroidales bacterium]
MKPLYRNIFLLFGVAAIVVMLCTFDVDYRQLSEMLPRAIAFLPAVVGVWVFVYAFNAAAFQIIVNSGKHDKHLSFRHAYKLTVSGFAFSYTTPFGFGGGPYRVMELAAHIGTNRAMSSVVLYSMMHILSHICLWASAAALFIIVYTEKMDAYLWACAGIFLAALLFALYFFYKGYKNGLIVKLYRLLFFIPFANRYAKRFYEKNAENMAQIDRNIAYLHEQPRAFCGSLLLEYLARVVNALEYYFILWAFGAPVTFVDAILVLAFSSLMGNILFFFPMQMGAREGGLALIIKILGYPNGLGLGVFSSFFTRVRELVWIFIGVGLVKVGNKKIMK